MTTYSRRLSYFAKYAAGYLPCGHKLTKPREKCDVCQYHQTRKAMP